MVIFLCYNSCNTLSIKIKCEDKESISHVALREPRLLERGSDQRKKMAFEQN